MTFDIIIIGSGLAGYTLIKEFRQRNQTASVLLITADDGSYYSKPLLSTGFAKHKTAADLTMHLAVKMAQDLNITLYASTKVLAIDSVTQQLMVENSAQPIHYQQSLVLATGAQPMGIPLPKALNGRCLAINDLQDYGHFREALGGLKNVCIIGSGLVGTEYANDLCDSGRTVSVVSLDDAPLQLLLPKPLSDAVQAQLTERGISWHMNTMITDAKLTTNEQLLLQLSNGQSVTCDLVLSAVGLRPRIELAEQAGLTVERGIVVDQTLQTSAPKIYALGDCAQINGLVLMYVTPLTLSAKALAKTLNGDVTAVNLPAAPVIVKTPACPVVANPPAFGAQGHWSIEGEAPDLKACYLDDQGQLLGFGLTGKKVMERMKLTKQLPALL